MTVSFACADFFTNTSGGLEASRVEDGLCRLFYVIARSTAAAAQEIQIFDAAALPADGAAPVMSLKVPADSQVSIDFGPGGRLMREGVVVCNSSTVATKTIGAADCLFDIGLRKGA